MTKQNKALAACPKTGLAIMHPKIAKLFRECLAKYTTRYAIETVCAGDGWLCATDGRRLVVLKIRHDLEHGLYVLSKDNLLLRSLHDLHFPKWEAVLIPDKQRKLCYKGSLADARNVGVVVYAINHNSGTCLDLELCMKPLLCMASMCMDVSVHVDNRTKGDLAVEVSGTAYGCELLYVQMPLSKDGAL